VAVSNDQHAKWYAELYRLKYESQMGNLNEVIQAGGKLEKEWPVDWGDPCRAQKNFGSRTGKSCHAWPPEKAENVEQSD
jgi:hypothetical protein